MTRIFARAGVLILVAAAVAAGFMYRDVYMQRLPFLAAVGSAGATDEIPTVEGSWICTMHPHVEMDHEDTCPICGMNLEFVPESGTASATGSDTSGPASQAAAGTREDPYVGRGVIEEIDPDARRLVLAHQEIPGLMGAMTMGFPVSEEVPVESLSIGETVEFRIETVDPDEAEGNSIRIFDVSTGASDTAAAVDRSQAMFTVDTRRQQLSGVRTAPVSYVDFNRDLRTLGIVRLDETRLSEVHAKISGWIEETFVDFVYQHVEKGDPLFTIYSPELVATQEEYLLAMKGLDQLGDSPFESVAFGAQDLLRSARRRLQLWDISDRQIEELEQAREPFRTITVYSPVSGHVMSREAFPGQRVTPDTTLYGIADHSVVWVEADVYENELTEIRMGQPATMRVQGLPGREFSGEVTFVNPHMNEQTRTLKVRLEFPNPDLELKPGMYADVELHSNMGRRLAVPESAVLPTGRRNIVFVSHGEGRMEIRNIQLGTKVQDHYEVLGGLEEGETVVVSGNFLIDAESKLQAAEPSWQGENPQ